MSRGDVCWADLPVDGRRPVVVITRDEAIPRLTRVLVAPVTRTIRGIDGEVVLGPEDGLGKESVANLYNVQVIATSRLGPIIGRLSWGHQAEVCVALAYVSGCGERVAA
jgi:mRNA interferase MazF